MLKKFMSFLHFKRGIYVCVMLFMVACQLQANDTTQKEQSILIDDAEAIQAMLTLSRI